MKKKRIPCVDDADFRRFFFSYQGLSEFIRHMKLTAPVVTLRDFSGGPGIILRHDVDLDLEFALKVAEIEIEADVRSTFFINLSSCSFNPATKRNREIIRLLADKGFEIGLHFDPTLHPGAGKKQMAAFVAEEADYLSTLSTQPVESVSLHQPSVHEQYPIFSGFNNAYAPEIFGDSCYLSDSCMSFRGKDPYEFVSRACHQTVQVLLHPMHFSEDGSDYRSITQNYFLQFFHLIETSSDLGENREARKCMPNGISEAVSIKLQQ
jgi:hypothetical protein